MLPRTTRSVILIYCHVKPMLIMNLWLYMVHGTMVRPDDTNSVKIFVLSIWFSLWNSTFGYKGSGTLDIYFVHITYWHFKQFHCYIAVTLYKKWSIFLCRDSNLCIRCNFSRSLPLNSENERTTEMYCGSICLLHQRNCWTKGDAVWYWNSHRKLTRI